MRKMKGLIALDIDGTITPDIHRIPPEVVDFLGELVSEGWEICMITGRCFTLAIQALEVLPFSYHLAVLNGALTLKMPEREIVAKKYLDWSVLPTMDAICEGEPTDCAIYAGYDHDDVIYYRPDRFSSVIRQYVEERAAAFKETWLPVSSYDQLDLKEIASLKCIAPLDVAERIANRANEELEIAMPLIRDPRQEGYYVAQGTHPDVDKGEAMKRINTLLNGEGPMIAAGDDRNDASMLVAADVSVVMETAPQEIHKLGDIIAKPAKENGIIAGLQEVIRRGS